MNWFASRRMDYITWRLATLGEVQRNDIVRHFGVSETQASIDINAFLRDNPGSASYDKTRKRYVPPRRYTPAAPLRGLAEALGWD